LAELIGVPPQVLFGQLLLGLINGAFYATLSLGLAVIFGLLNIINFAHGALYMMGAFVAWFLLEKTGLGYWWALVVAPPVVGLFGILIAAVLIYSAWQMRFRRAVFEVRTLRRCSSISAMRSTMTRPSTSSFQR